MSKKPTAEIAEPAVPTELELVQQRVAQAGVAINEFTNILFDGVRGKIEDLKAQLSAELLAQRVSDAMIRLSEINNEVKLLADEAAAATDQVTFRLLLTRIAILKVSYSARYKAALSLVPGGPDDATIAKEVGKLFDAIVKEIGDRRKDATRPLLPAPAAEEAGETTEDWNLNGARYVTLTSAEAQEPDGIYSDPVGAPVSSSESSEPSGLAWTGDPEAGEGENPADDPTAAVVEEDIVQVTERGTDGSITSESLVETTVVAGATSPEPEPESESVGAPESVSETEPEPQTESAGEPEPSIVPQVGFPMSKTKLKHGKRSREKATA